MGSELGTKIRRLREQAGLTQVQLARMAEVSREWLAKIESGKNPTLFVVVRLAAALETRLPHLSLADLFEGYDAILPMRSAQTPLVLREDPGLPGILGPAGQERANTGRLLSVRDTSRGTILDAMNRRNFLAYVAATAVSPNPLWPPGDTSRKPPLLGANDHFERTDALSLGAWIESTNTSDEVIEYLDALASTVAREHVYFPTATVLNKALRIHHQIQAILQGGRQRLRQSRELLRIDAGVLAHICLLFGDVRRDKLAAAYGGVAILAANEAGSSSAEAYSAQAQIARWRHRYSEAADLAAQGLASSPPTSVRVLLACQEANAAALAGDAKRARQALAQAETARVDTTDEGLLDSAWSCPPGRYALYRLSAALHSGDSTTALHEAEKAEAAWTPDQPKPFGTWAHLRIAAGHAHLMSGSLDGAALQIGPVLDLPSEYRLATLTEHMATVEAILRRPHFRGSGEASMLRERMREFNSNLVWGKQ